MSICTPQDLYSPDGLRVERYAAEPTVLGSTLALANKPRVDSVDEVRAGGASGVEYVERRRDADFARVCACVWFTSVYAVPGPCRGLQCGAW